MSAGYAYGDVLRHRQFREVVMVIGYIGNNWAAVTIVESDEEACYGAGCQPFKPGDIRLMSPFADYEECE